MTDIYALAEQMLTEATEGNIAEEDNLASIKAAFTVLAADAWRRGDLMVDVSAIVTEHLWLRVDKAAAQRTQKVLRQLVRGQVSIAEVDAVLGCVIKVGRNRRTTLRNLNAQDLVRMVGSRRDNLDKVEQAFTEFVDDIAAPVAGWLADYKTIPGAIKAGAIHFAAESTEQSA